MIDKSQGEAEPQFVTDADGNRIGVLLDLDRYRELLDAVDELDAIQAYDAAKSSGEDAVSLADAINDIERTPVMLKRNQQ